MPRWLPLGTRILGMRKRLFWVALQLFATLSLIALVDRASAQSASTSNAPVMGVVLTKLSTPVYPPLSRQAQITGDVKIVVLVERDGSLAGVAVVSGHQMLWPAAVASAQRSTFECRGCTQERTAYSLTYTFGLRHDVDCAVTRLHSVKCLYLWRCGGWRNHEIRPSAVTQSQDHIAILADAACVETSSSNSSGG